MFGSNLIKHWKEFRNYTRNNQYEAGEGQIYFPKASVAVGGVYTGWVTGYESEVTTDANLIPNEGLNFILNDIMLTSPLVAPRLWYVMLHSGSGTPDAATTAATYESLHSEITSGAEGYSEATRVLWVGDAVDTVNTEVTNDATPAAFTIVTSTSLGVWGAAITSISTKTSAAGTLMSLGKFSAQRSLSNTDVFNLKYKIDFDAV